MALTPFLRWVRLDATITTVEDLFIQQILLIFFKGICVRQIVKDAGLKNLFGDGKGVAHA